MTVPLASASVSPWPPLFVSSLPLLSLLGTLVGLGSLGQSRTVPPGDLDVRMWTFLGVTMQSPEALQKAGQGQS